MTDFNPVEDLSGVLREARIRLESLRRAGVDRLPRTHLATPLPPLAFQRSLSTRPEAPLEVQPAVQEKIPAIEPNNAPLPVLTATPVSLFEEVGFDSPVVAEALREEQLRSLAAEVSVCVRCPALATTRTQTVFGDGSPRARLFFVGEAPGADEDRTGIPFVGRAGALLNDMITKGMGLNREDVYIANILKSRPPENRNPLPDEIAHCLPYLERQIEIIRPEFLCMLGKVAASTLLETALPLGKLRGKWHRYRGIATIVTYHPAYLLRNPASKKEAWEDLQMLMQAMGLKVGSRKKT